MAFITEPDEIIEIDDDSSDDLQPWAPQHPARLQAMGAPPISQGYLPREREFQWATPAVQTPPSPNPNLDLDLNGGLLDQELLNMEAAVMMDAEPRMDVDTTSDYDTNEQKVLKIFSDISRDHVKHLYDAQLLQPRDGQTIAEHLIAQILDDGKYPKEKDRLKELKRKRDSDEEELAYMKNLERNPFESQYTQAAKLVLQEEFPDIPSRYIDLKYKETTQFFATYQALDRASRTWEESADRPYSKLKRPRTQRRSEDLSFLSAMIPGGYGVEELKREIMAARRLRKKEDAKEQAKKDVSAAEAAKEKEYRDRGDVLECGTCCDELPTYKFTHCDGETPHFLCSGCLQNYANTEIGNQRYTLDCLHEDGCKATYSRKERQRVLDAKTFETLERLQQQAELKLANMTDLEHCPFCDFAAICPPVKVDKEFRCGNPECERISCRLCQKDSHIPLSCKEYKDTFGVEERHAVEEAMTKALLKTCPKCGKQILKQDGCNKVVCFCGGMMCDYCGKDITKDGYNHFSNPGPGGMGSNSKKCPTHDNTEQRRKAQVDKAQAEAIKKAREENPNLTEEQLKLKFSKEVERESSRAFDPFHGIPGPQIMHHMADMRAIMRQEVMQRDYVNELANRLNRVHPPYQPPGALLQPHQMPQPYQQHMPAIPNNAAVPQPHPAYVPAHPLPQQPAYHDFGHFLADPFAPFGPPPTEAQRLETQRLVQLERQRIMEGRPLPDQHNGAGQQAYRAALANRNRQPNLDHPMPDYIRPYVGFRRANAMPDADRNAQGQAPMAGVRNREGTRVVDARPVVANIEGMNQLGAKSTGERKGRPNR